ncbi:hypothetical protein [Deinococcus sp. QL22]|uniref:hypothetical protein n=1 Tax=Deinococcus sp. QL22 TaxID=2939437 RepID=UPI002016AEB5|nr:hypothetical protein [Deinococcus sp. QL22]UQN08508.1 hypothetical protein M1R55_17520 [Deinococcus sp. QL22]
MTTKLKFAPLALALALLAPAPTFAQSSTIPSTPAQSSTAQRGLGSLVGVWRMTSLEVGTPGNL